MKKLIILVLLIALALATAVEEAVLDAIADAVTDEILADAEVTSCTTDSVNLRSGPCTSNTALTVLQAGTKVTELGERQNGCGYNWKKVSVNGRTGWIAADFLGKCSSSGGGNANVREAGKRAAAWALEQVGKAYCTAPNLTDRRGPRCFDCTGLVSRAWELQGFKGNGYFPFSVFPESPDWYPRATEIKKVSSSELQPGDVLWRDGHVGMFVGNGQVVEAMNYNLGVRKNALSSFTYSAIYRPK
jgi:cell wall-associated NlpC family hydrolase